ncbi:hypothetical protein [Parapedobacter sp. 10938]|uniref:hypothetical protein n=1 Tax=Parapedobacter flavus TaxID=3110225 RepID=UPI002DB92B15|nr:hypothetical protein [Parapedobacter sp. 10938]MEC3879750.1 hypothetical protein [Parapedobacter sp. 10938]
MTSIKNKQLRIAAVTMMSISVLSLVGGNLLFAIPEKPAPEPKVLNQTWHFTGSTALEAINPAFYEQGSASSCGAGTETICEISAPVDPNSPNPADPKPDMDAIVSGSETVADQITEALDEGINDTVLSLREI